MIHDLEMLLLYYIQTRKKQCMPLFKISTQRKFRLKVLLFTQTLTNKNTNPSVCSKCIWNIPPHFHLLYIITTSHELDQIVIYSTSSEQRYACVSVSARAGFQLLYVGLQQKHTSAKWEHAAVVPLKLLFGSRWWKIMKWNEYLTFMSGRSCYSFFLIPGM